MMFGIHMDNKIKEMIDKILNNDTSIDVSDIVKYVKENKRMRNDK